MEITTSVHAYRIDCTFYRDDPDLLNQLGLCVLIAAKFEGEIDRETFSRNMLGNEDGLMLSIQFDDYHATDAARSWFGRNLVKGSVDRGYVGAIPRADPGLRESRDIQEQLMDLPKWNRSKSQQPD